MPPQGTSETVAQAIRSRRAIRHYRPDPVPAPLLRELIDLALEAPSSYNLQARSIVAVTGAAGLRALTEATGGQPHPQEAPVVLVFVAESGAWREGRDDIWREARERGAWTEAYAAGTPGSVKEFYEARSERGLERECAIKDAMLAAAFLMVAAEAAGLGTSPMGGWDETAVKRAIGIADRPDLHIALLVPLGYPGEVRLHPGRRSPRLTTHHDTYGSGEPAPGFSRQHHLTDY
ncbi:nitroreductase family protein [Streptomyces fuscigenes]|uniref:nitroreductase family protein n=1 Tax=Streptomyces fuscigenes TaxID=1528880 RepID=UPI001F212DF7|nr:nitroreductase family protein [Streptomyces fuscigenes]MCF3961011.1 nitroreductase family protein [Streptomyces fuscigenes]